MEKRILIDGRLLSNHPTGISRYTEQLIKALREKYCNEAVSVIVNRDYSGTKDYNLIHTKYKPYHPLHFLLFSFFINKLNFSIYYSPFYSGIWFKKDKRKQVITVHDLMYWRIRNYFSENALVNGLSKFVFNLLVRSTLRASNLMISVSETTRKDLQELFGRDSVVIGEGVNELEEKERGEREKIESEKGENEKWTANDSQLHSFAISRLQEACKDGYFLYVGNFRKPKNVDFLIEAFLRSDTPYWLLLAGFATRRLHDITTSRLHQGKSKRENENLRRGNSCNETTSRLHDFTTSRGDETGVENENLRRENSDRIVYTGALDDSEIHYLYKNCKAFVLPSLYEGFGLPVLEAYCAGAKVFSSNAGALKEFSHLNIHYFSPVKQEELVSLLQRADQLSKPSEVEIERTKMIYSWEKQMAKLVDTVDVLMR